jgi:poly(3-hydroxybutyrate) depolymerase
MQQIMASLESTYCIDTRRRFATGFSWGGDMVNALACCLGPTFRAVANASGGELWNGTCPNLERPAFRITYANNDAYPQSGFDQVMDFFRGAQGCAGSSSTTTPSPCRAWNGCAKPVIECRYTGLGHTFPSGWADDTWAFFATFQ